MEYKTDASRQAIRKRGEISLKVGDVLSLNAEIYKHGKLTDPITAKVQAIYPDYVVLNNGRYNFCASRSVTEKETHVLI
jgi:hypothetical protein